MDCDDVAVLHTQIMANDTIETSASVIQVIVGKNNENGVLPLLTANEDCITTEQLESVHGVVGKSDDGVVIIDGIGNHQLVGLLPLLQNSRRCVIVLFQFWSASVRRV